MFGVQEETQEGEEGDTNEGEEDDQDKLKPYKTDLEYLEDHIQLIAYKLKNKGLEKLMEMEVNFIELCCLFDDYSNLD